MTKLKFKIIGKCWQDASRFFDKGIDFYLEESDWNDYGYTTSYCLHATKAITGKDKNEYLGSLRIMKKGQTTNDIYILRKLYGKNDLTFTELPVEFVSLTFSIEIFQELSHLLNADKRKEFVQALHLILGSDSPFFRDLDNDECFNSSLLRDSSSLDSYGLKRAKTLMYGEASYYDLRQQSINVNFAHIDNPVLLDFSCIPDFDSDLLPNGMAVFIGKNGSGKSTAIYKLAKLLYAEPTERFRLKKSVGVLEPNDIGVNKLFLVSYSPFDNFVLPGATDSDYQLMLSKDEVRSQRFVFCGIRDIKREYEELRKLKRDDESNDTQWDRQEQTFLKPIGQLADEFVNALQTIFNVGNEKNSLWTKLYRHCKQLQPALYNDMMPFIWEDNRENYTQQFNSLSTGHKFFLHTMAHLVAFMEDDSLVLFDEPENHLHPPLLSFMIAELRTILSNHKSVMFIATHSPIILQETFAKNVYVVRRDGVCTTIRKPRIETYGENLSSIISEVFDLTTDVTKYYTAFEYLFDKWMMAEESNIEMMLDKFEKRLGHQLSDQMESYLINLYVGGKENVEVK